VRSSDCCDVVAAGLAVVVAIDLRPSVSVTSDPLTIRSSSVDAVSLPRGAIVALWFEAV
jgi:hypothetical protein